VIVAAERLAAVLESTPYAARLGLRAGAMTSDAVTASVPYVPVLANAQGFVHGGVAASLSVWSAMIVAVASDRDRAASSRPVSVSVSYLVAAREEGLHATARVASRGRDLVHVAVEIDSDRGRQVASALLVLRIASDEPRLRTRIAAAPVAASSRGLISPFSQSMGIELRGDRATGAQGAESADSANRATHAENASTVAMAMRRDSNEGLAGAVDPGALVALADTCAALACLPSLDERLSGSATLSLSAVFGDPLHASALATGRSVAEDGGLRSALVVIGADGVERASRLHAMTACVAYRFLGADSSRS